MSRLFPLLVVFPLASFVALVALRPFLSRGMQAVIGVAGTGLSFILSLAIASDYASPLEFNLGSWVGPYFSYAVRLDGLSLVMTMVVMLVGTLILLYSTEFIEKEEGHCRFFASMNLFIASMTLLLLADDFLLLFLGWEGVGLCSYLLIGFWYRDAANVNAARKAFIVTRIGDAAFLMGILLVFRAMGPMTISQAMLRLPQVLTPGSAVVTAVAALFLAGAVGKSAQLPLQVWLPDAMAGPTPVSALIHAATMVTAGVYLICRTNALFCAAPAVKAVIVLIGMATLLVASFSALVQRDIKKVLAYSTMSQVGYMIFAAGLGAYSAAVFHFVMHAFFKSLLFLSAGVIVLGLKHSRDMYDMGGLRKVMPLTFAVFLIGASSLAALPLVTAGFWSKDAIIFYAWSSMRGGALLWAGALVGSVMTALYSFRMVMLVFFGELKTLPLHRPGLRMRLPLLVLSVLSIAGGLINMPNAFPLPHFLDNLLGPLFPALRLRPAAGGQGLFSLVSSVVSVGAAAAAILLFGPLRSRLLALKGRGLQAAGQLLANGWGFDFLYKALIERPFLGIARHTRNDPLGVYGTPIARSAGFLSRCLGFLQNGNLRWYAAGIACGVVVLLAVGVL